MPGPASASGGDIARGVEALHHVAHRDFHEEGEDGGEGFGDGNDEGDVAFDFAEGADFLTVADVGLGVVGWVEGAVVVGC